MELSEASAMFDALGQQTRLALLRLLITSDAAGLPAGKIAERIGMPASTTSFHLGVLERSGLVRSLRRGREIVYSARIGAIHDMARFLRDTCGADTSEPKVVPAPQGGIIASFNVLFLCTRNSARSLMAESILHRAGSGRFNAYSAGNEPADEPMDQVLRVLRRHGHDVGGLRCKSWDGFLRPDAPRMDFVIGLCDTLSDDFHVKFGGAPLTALWPLPDPVRFQGTDVQMGQLMAQLYAGLYHRIETFADLPFATLGRSELGVRLDALADDPIELTTQGMRN